MEQEFELIAKTFMGLEPVLAKELVQLGANNVQIGRRMVSFTGNKEMMYRANFQLHTAIRILKPIRHFKAKSAADEVATRMCCVLSSAQRPRGCGAAVAEIITGFLPRRHLGSQLRAAQVLKSPSSWGA